MLSMQSLHCPVWKLKQYCPKIRDALTQAENGISETYTTSPKIIKDLHPGGTYNSVMLYRSSAVEVAERASCILKNLFSLAQVQIPKIKLRRELYTDSTLVCFHIQIE